MTADDIASAVRYLLAGELVGLPTETVYGLAADARNPAAVQRIFTAKGRPADHPLIVHLAHPHGLRHWACQIPDITWKLTAFWPGPLTLILKKQDWVPALVTGGQETVGLRIPSHPVAHAVLREMTRLAPDAGIAAPSANRFGAVSPTTAQHVREELGCQVDLILDGGACEVGIESTILDLSRGEPVVLRPGPISPAQLALVLGQMPSVLTTADAPRVSGALESHYAPHTPMRLLVREQMRDYLNAAHQRGERCGVIAFSLPETAEKPHSWRQLPSTPDAYAQAIYATLRELDVMGLDVMVTEAVPDTPGWAAIADRLRRAAS